MMVQSGEQVPATAELHTEQAQRLIDDAKQAMARAQQAQQARASASSSSPDSSHPVALLTCLGLVTACVGWAWLQHRQDR